MWLIDFPSGHLGQGQLVRDTDPPEPPLVKGTVIEVQWAQILS